MSYDYKQIMDMVDNYVGLVADGHGLFADEETSGLAMDIDRMVTNERSAIYANLNNGGNKVSNYISLASIYNIAKVQIIKMQYALKEGGYGDLIPSLDGLYNDYHNRSLQAIEDKDNAYYVECLEFAGWI